MKAIICILIISLFTIMMFLAGFMVGKSQCEVIRVKEQKFELKSINPSKKFYI